MKRPSVKKIKEENDKLTKLYERFKNNELSLPEGVVEYKTTVNCLLKVINFTLAYCAGVNPKAPSEWIMDTLTLWS